MKDLLVTFLETAVTTFDLRGPVVQVGGGHDYCMKRLTADDEYLLCRLETEARTVRLPVPDRAARLAILVDPESPRVTSTDEAGALTARKQSCMRQLLAELIRSTAPGGAILVALRTDTAKGVGAPEPSGWIPTPNLIQSWFSGLAVSLVGWQGESLRPGRIFGVGLKDPVGPMVAQSVGTFFERMEQRAAAAVGWLGRGRKILQTLRSKFHGSVPIDPDQLSWLVHYAQDRDDKSSGPHVDLLPSGRRSQDMV